MIKEAKRLHDLGLAIHWLRPKSKWPVEAGWTTGPRKDWKYLGKTFKSEYNVGVRLGTPSVVKAYGSTNYLAVIDCDVKSTDKKHKREMLDKMSEEFGSLPNASVVLSGRGNGSRHYYILTTAPALARRVAQSPDKIRVMMPSVDPSKLEKQNLSATALKQGWRIRAAWEISVMGEGQQVVLPPSTHPDSGKPYTWLKGLTQSGSLPLLDLQASAIQERKTYAEDFKVTPVDIAFDSRIDDRTADLILSGKGCEDRSAGLFSAAMALRKAGLTDNEILTVLTDRDTYLGLAGYEHAKTNSRQRAAAWVSRYTLAKAKLEADGLRDFDALVEVETLSAVAAKEQDAEVYGRNDPENWKAEIERTDPRSGDKPKNTLKNVWLILSKGVAENVFVRNDFTATESYGVLPPWGGAKGEELRDIDVVRIKKWLADTYRFEPSDDRINQAIAKIADSNRFHPVRTYLDGLTWDGVPRLDTWLRDYLGAKAPESYLRSVSRKVLVAMVARIYKPGTKFDHVLILENKKQGIGKSTSVRRLAGDAWFSDATLNIADKDSVLSMNGVWVVELGELSGMRKADVDQLKEFVSRSTDRIRVPYGKRTENFPRQCVFIGTTNNTEYLRDTTGNRRFWPVSVGNECDFDAIEANRDQLFAEAKFAYELNEPLWLDDPEAQAQAVAQQERRTFRDTWVDKIKDFLDDAAKPDAENVFPFRAFTTEDLFGDFGALPGTKDDRAEQMRAAEALRKLGYEKRQGRRDGKKGYYWSLQLQMNGN